MAEDYFTSSSGCSGTTPCKKKRRISRDLLSEDAIECSKSPNKELLDGLKKTVQELSRCVGSNFQELQVELLEKLLHQLQEEPSRDDSMTIGVGRSIQSAILLHLGYTLSMMQPSPTFVNSESDQAPAGTQECILCLLCQCLCQLYRCTPGGTIVVVSEYKEVVALMRQVFNRLLLDSSIMEQAQTIRDACLEISWFLANYNEFRHECSNSILKSLVRIMVAFRSETHQVLRILEVLSHSENRKARTVYTAACVIAQGTAATANTAANQEFTTTAVQDLNKNYYTIGCQIHSGHQDKIDWQGFFSQGRQDDALLFVHCLCYAPDIARRLAGCAGLLDILYSHALSNRTASSEFAVGASDCLSTIALYCGVCCTPELLAVLTNIVCLSPMLPVRQKAVCGLLRVTRTDVKPLMRHLLCNKMSTDAPPMEQLLTSLEELIVASTMDNRGTTVGEDATSLIAKIFVYVFINKYSMEHHEQAIETLASLMFCNDPKVVRIAVRTICDYTMREPDLQRHQVLDGTGVLDALCHVASSEFSSTEIKQLAVESMWNLGQVPETLQILTRTPRVLEALVMVASRNNNNNNVIRQDQEQVRRLAIQTLMRLSSHACNQRVLAKQPGLLSCLIRFVRSLPTDEDDDVFDKDQLKARILKLAVLL